MDDMMKAGRTKRPGRQTAPHSTEEDFFAVLGTVSLPMTLADPHQPDMPLVFVNQAFLDLTGYGRAEVLGRNCRFLQGAGREPHACDAIRDAMAHQAELRVELRNYRRDGSAFWNALLISPVFGPDGGLRYYFGAQQDVTARHETEATLRQAEKMQAVGELTGGIAHDFNNLLTVLGGGIEVLAGEAPAARRQRSSHLARAALDRARQLTRQLQAFACRQQLNPQPEELGALVLECDEAARRCLGPEIALHLDLHPLPCRVRVDRAQVQAALMALLANARDAMPAGGRALLRTGLQVVEPASPCHPALEPGTYCMLELADTGHGMAPDVLRRAPEPFFTTRQGLPGRGGAGLGLGLSGVYGFMRQSRGHLTLDSTPGQGTQARLLFPAEAG